MFIIQMIERVGRPLIAVVPALPLDTIRELY